MKKTISAGVAAILISGCASQAELTELSKYSAEVVRAQAAMVEQPTLTVKCGDSADACKGLDLSFTHPADRHRMVVPRVRGTNDVIVETAPSVVKGVTWLGGAFAATRMVDDIMTNTGSGNTTTHTTTSVIGDENSTTASSSLSNSRDDSITGDSSVDRHDDNSTVDSHDAVSTPTVVTQPTPVIVEPTVVQPAIIEVPATTQGGL